MHLHLYCIILEVLEFSNPEMLKLYGGSWINNDVINDKPRNIMIGMR